MAELPKIDLLRELAKAAELVFKQIIAHSCQTSDFYEETSILKQRDSFIQEKDKIIYSKMTKKMKQSSTAYVPLTMLLKCSKIQQITDEFLPANSKLEYKVRILRNAIQQKSNYLWATYQNVRLINTNELQFWSCKKLLLAYVSGIEGQVNEVQVLTMLGLMREQNGYQKQSEIRQRDVPYKNLFEFEVIIKKDLMEQDELIIQRQTIFDSQRQYRRHKSNKLIVSSSAWIYYLNPHQLSSDRKSFEEELHKLKQRRQYFQNEYNILILTSQQYVESQQKASRLTKGTAKLDINPYIAHQIPNSKNQLYSDLMSFDNSLFFRP